MTSRPLVRAALQRLIERSPALALPLRAQLQRAQHREEPEMRLLPWLVSRGGLAVDVGANRGIYTWRLSQLVDRVLAVEANPTYVPFLKSITPGRVRVVHAALSDEDGEAWLHVPTVGRHSGGLGTIERTNGLTGELAPQTFRVPRRRLDDVVGSERVCFIKVDVEGHELAVLKGSDTVLRRDNPILLVEAENRHRPKAVESVREHLAKLGYSGWMLLDGTLTSINLFHEAVHQIVPTDHQMLDLGLKPTTYLNNFIFLPTGSSPGHAAAT